jgi:hypothetical protein
LQLPDTSNLHPLFHVSQLKKAVDSKCTVTLTIPAGLTSPQVPEQILQQRLVTRGSRTVLQVLVKWSAWPSSLSTWEDKEALLQRFPAAPVWGQPGAKEGWDVNAANIQKDVKAGAEVETAGRRKSSRTRRPNV